MMHEALSKLRENLQAPELRRLVRFFPKGAALFEQGQVGESAFLVLSGLVQLSGDRGFGEYVENLVGPGDLLGEKALLGKGPYQRLFGAASLADSTVLELGPRDLEALERVLPAVAASIDRVVLHATVERLLRVNFLVRGLRTSDVATRVMAVIGYFCRATGERQGAELDVLLSAAGIAQYVDIDVNEADAYLDQLEQRGLLRSAGSGHYRVANEAALNDAASALNPVSL